MRHVGLTESIAMIADAMGWTLDRITDDIQPKIATVTVSSEFLAVDPGYVCGIIQDGVGYRKGEPVITLHMEAYLGAPGVVRRGRDRRVAEHLDRRSPAASTATSRPRRSSSTRFRRCSQAAPGLHTMRDLPLPSFFPGV